jgi:hypothetical protein
MAFATTIRLKGRRLNVMQYVRPPSPFFPHGQLYMAFSRFSFDNVAVSVVEWHRQRIENDRFIRSKMYIEK